jgi:hypothetical protein
MRAAEDIRAEMRPDPRFWRFEREETRVIGRGMTETVRTYAPIPQEICGELQDGA